MVNCFKTINKAYFMIFILQTYIYRNDINISVRWVDDWEKQRDILNKVSSVHF